MSQPDPPADLIERFANGALLPEAIRAEKERRLRVEMKALLIPPDAIVGAQPDKTVALALRNDFFSTEALNELCNRYSDRMHSWLIRWGVEYNDASNLAQETLLHCLCKLRLETFNPEKGTLTNYLRAAAWKRWKGDKRKRSPSYGEHPEPEYRGPSPATILEGAELTARFARALSLLTDEQRQLLELCLGNCTHDEIAQTLGIPVTSLYGRLHRARMRLVELGIKPPPTDRGRPRKPNNPPDSDA